jgi:hypothetical protein
MNVYSDFAIPAIGRHVTWISQKSKFLRILFEANASNCPYQKDERANLGTF